MKEIFDSFLLEISKMTGSEGRYQLTNTNRWHDEKTGRYLEHKELLSELFIPIAYLEKIAKENEEVAKRHTSSRGHIDPCGEIAYDTADIINGIIWKWRRDNAETTDQSD